MISSRRESAAAADDEFAKEFGLDEPAKPHAGLINAGPVLAGLVLLVVGSNFRSRVPSRWHARSACRSWSSASP